MMEGSKVKFRFFFNSRTIQDLDLNPGSELSKKSAPGIGSETLGKKARFDYKLTCIWSPQKPFKAGPNFLVVSGFSPFGIAAHSFGPTWTGSAT